MSEPLQLPPPPPGDEDDDKPKTKTIARFGHTTKEADRALKKFMKNMVSGRGVSGIAEFGEFVIDRGTKNQGIGLMTYVAHSAMIGISDCEDMSKTIDDPELRVRLQENKLKYLETVGKVGKDLANTEDNPSDQPDKQPAVSLFPPNTKVEVNYVAAPTEKTLES